MQVSECSENEITYGHISIRLKNKYADIRDAQTVLTEFMRQLQPAFSIRHSTGPNLEPQDTPKKLTVTDYWQDAQQLDWKVQGWTDGAIIAVLYIKNINQLPVWKEELYLNGRVFAKK